MKTKLNKIAKRPLFIPVMVLAIMLCVLLNSCKKEKAAPLTSLGILGKDTIFIRKGQTNTLKYTYNPVSGVSPDLGWDTSDKNVADVAGDGTVTAINIGKATITLWVNDGTGLKTTRTIYVLEKPTISIKSISQITYYSASFSLQYNLGGGTIGNSSLGLVWDTVPTLDTAKVTGKYKFNVLSDNYNIDLFDAGKKLYARAYIKTPLDTVYSDSELFETLPVPEGTLGNYMLNIPLAWGLVAKYKDWIYYNNFTDKNKLYKIKTDLTEKQKVTDVASGVGSLSIIGSDIYYTGKPKTGGYIGGYSNIMRMKLDGSKQFQYGNGWGYSNKYLSWGTVAVYGNYIYPCNSDFFRFSSDLKDSVPHMGFTQYTNVYNNKLYFCLNKMNSIDTLYTINESSLDGSERKELYRGYHYYYFAGNGNLGIYKNAAYFIENQIFKKFDLSSPGIVEILPISTYYYNIANDAIYFSNRDDADKLYKSDMGGLLISKFCDDSVNAISVIDDWLYYYTHDKHLYRIKQDGTNRQLVD